VHHHPSVPGLGPQVGRDELESAVERIENSRSRKYVLELSGFHVAAVAFLFAVISLSVGLTVGRGPLGMHFRDTEKSIPAVDATSPALLNRPGATSSLTSTPPAANTFHAPAVNPPPPETEESSSENATANPEPSPERNGSTGLSARNSPPRVSPKPVHSPKAVGPTSVAPRNLAPRGITPSAVLVRGPGDGSKPFRLTLPEEPIAASSSFAMTSQLSVLVAPEPGAGVTHEPARLQPAELVSFVWPRYPRPGDRYGSSETVKVRTTIGKLGQVLDVKLVSGSTSLLPAAMSAIRLWRYRPTLLNKRPVQAQQDVTIEYLPPQYSSHVASQHPSHN
jgi:TonB family protein